MKYVWIVSGTTESGDDWQLAFDTEPSEARIIEVLMATPGLQEEYEAECIQGWSVNKEAVLSGQSSEE
jgi:hypothetical protein